MMDCRTKLGLVIVLCLLLTEQSRAGCGDCRDEQRQQEQRSQQQQEDNRRHDQYIQNQREERHREEIRSTDRIEGIKREERIREDRLRIERQQEYNRANPVTPLTHRDFVEKAERAEAARREEIRQAERAAEVRAAEIRADEVRRAERVAQIRAEEIRRAERAAEVRAAEIRAEQIRQAERTADIRAAEIRTEQIRQAERTADIRAIEIRAEQVRQVEKAWEIRRAEELKVGNAAQRVEGLGGGGTGKYPGSPLDMEKDPKKDPRETFVGPYATRKLDSPETFYRYTGYNPVTGKKYSFLTNKRYDSETTLRRDLAIPKYWEDPDTGELMESKIIFESEITVPAGVIVYEGKTAKQGDMPGGGYQAVIPNLPRQWKVRTNNLPCNENFPDACEEELVKELRHAPTRGAVASASLLLGDEAVAPPRKNLRSSSEQANLRKLLEKP